MRHPRPVLAYRLPASVLGALCAAAAACGPASFPDASAVAAAQAKWCEALAKASGASGSWEHMGACKGATPGASAGYLRAMAKCFPAHKEAHGDRAPDTGILVAECRDEVLAKVTIDETTAQEAMEARCDRAARCEKANVAECLEVAKKAEPHQRLTLYGIYNGATIHKISDCLKSSGCLQDEYAAQTACYKSVDDKLLWFP